MQFAVLLPEKKSIFSISLSNYVVLLLAFVDSIENLCIVLADANEADLDAGILQKEHGRVHTEENIENVLHCRVLTEQCNVVWQKPVRRLFLFALLVNLTQCNAGLLYRC